MGSAGGSTSPAARRSTCRGRQRGSKDGGLTTAQMHVACACGVPDGPQSPPATAERSDHISAPVCRQAFTRLCDDSPPQRFSQLAQPASQHLLQCRGMAGGAELGILIEEVGTRLCRRARSYSTTLPGIPNPTPTCSNGGHSSRSTVGSSCRLCEASSAAQCAAKAKAQRVKAARPAGAAKGSSACLRSRWHALHVRGGGRAGSVSWQRRTCRGTGENAGVNVL